MPTSSSSTGEAGARGGGAEGPVLGPIGGLGGPIGGPGGLVGGAGPSGGGALGEEAEAEKIKNSLK